MWKLFNRGLDGLMFFLLAAIVIILLSQVVFRYVLNNPLVGSEDAAKLATMWMVFVGAGLAVRDRLHIKIDYFIEKLPHRAQTAIDAVMNMAVLAFIATAMYQCINLFDMQHGMKSVGLNIDVTYFSAALPAGFALMAVYMIRQMMGRTDA
jgi:TRAP-type C4-dicarboxylate transport system permease small subunit